MAMAATAIAVAAAMRYPDWFRAQVVQAAMVHGLTYAKVARLYGVSNDNVRKWVNAAEETPAGLDRLEALEHRIARIEHYLALAEEIRRQDQESWYPFPAGHTNGRSVLEVVDGPPVSVDTVDTGRTEEHD
jgi:transposase-like protein